MFIRKKCSFNLLKAVIRFTKSSHLIQKHGYNSLEVVIQFQKNALNSLEVVIQFKKMRLIY